jgi:NitT/TauT family transport system substrate-binding protein
MVNRRSLVSCAWAAASLGVAAPAWGVETRSAKFGSLTIAITRPEALCQLPLHLAHRLGYAAEEGLRLEWLVCPDQDAAVQALIHGKAQVLSAPYTTTLKAHLHGLRWTAFVQLSRTPQFAVGFSRQGHAHLARRDNLRLALPKGSEAAYRVTQQFLQNQGVSAAQVQWSELDRAESALGLLRSRSVEGVCLSDPWISLVERDGGVRVMADTRTLAGTRLLFGELWPAMSLCTSVDVARQRADQCRALSHAVVHAQKWLQTAGLLDISRTVAEEYFQSDRGLYLSAFSHNREAWSPDGVFDERAPQIAKRVLTRWNPIWAEMDASLVYTVYNQWVKEAKARFRA